MSDKEFADFICEQINKNGGKVRDVKLMINSCFGGGVLDDIQRVFGPGGPCEGVPWVAVSASSPYESAWGWSDRRVDLFPEKKLGSGLTNALAGPDGSARRENSTNNVRMDFEAAVDNDSHGPLGRELETPVVAWGNGGDKITWRAPDGVLDHHEGFAFGGDQTHKRHHNNVENAADMFRSVWEGRSHSIQTIDGGNRQDLFDAIGAAAAGLDENSQLAIYIDDHGTISFDYFEWYGYGDLLAITDEEVFTADLPKGWYEALWGNWLTLDPLDVPYTTLDLEITQCDSCSGWEYLWNDYPLHFPEDNPLGPVRLEVPWFRIFPGENHFRVTPLEPNRLENSGNQPKAGPGMLELGKLELNSGGINELEADQRLTPSQSAAFYDPGRNGEGIFVELLANGRAVVYVFTYSPDGTGQSWMLGFGKQVGFGIVITEMFLPTGPSFGPNFNPDDLVMTPFSGLALYLPSCVAGASKGVLEITPGEVAGFGELLLSTEYVQLTEIIDCQTGARSPQSGFSGSWFDPSHNGEGIILEVLKDGTVVVQWFTYDSNGGQMWVQGTGTIENNVLTVDNLYTTSGTAYGAGFNPDDIVQSPWGTLTLEFLSCSMAKLNYSSSTGFGSGTLNMTKLTNLMDIPCEGQE